MCGLRKALALLLVVWQPVQGGQWDWSPSVWHGGQWWRKHYETDYWCLVTQDGELLHEEDVGGTRPGLSKAVTAVLEMHGPPERWDKTASGLRWPEQGQKDPVVEALLQLQEALGMKNRWDSRSFRSQLRRNIRRLCERERMPVPQWWEGGDLSTHQCKMRGHQFVNELLDAKLKAATGGQDSGGAPSQAAGPGPPPQATGLPAQGTASGLPAEGSDQQRDGLSAAQAITYMMQNMSDDLSVMHPGIQDEVRAAFGSPRMPVLLREAGGGSPAQGEEQEAQPWPVKGPESVSSASSFSTPRVERRTKSEPPRSPRHDLAEMDALQKAPRPRRHWRPCCLQAPRLPRQSWRQRAPGFPRRRRLHKPARAQTCQLPGQI